MYEWLPLLCGFKKTSFKNNWIILLIIQTITPIGPETISLHCRLHYSFSRATFTLLSIDLLFLAPCLHLPAIMDLTSITDVSRNKRTTAADLGNSIHWDLSIPFQETIKTGDLLGKYPAPVFSFSHWVVSDSLWPRGLQHARLPCPSPSPGTCSNSCPLNQWCHQTISSSVVPFSFCFQSFPASGSFLMTKFFASGGQSIGASVSPSVLPMNIQGWFPLRLYGLISCSPTLRSLLQHPIGLEHLLKHEVYKKETGTRSFLKLFQGSHVAWLQGHHKYE